MSIVYLFGRAAKSRCVVCARGLRWRDAVNRKCAGVSHVHLAPVRASSRIYQIREMIERQWRCILIAVISALLAAAATLLVPTL